MIPSHTKGSVIIEVVVASAIIAVVSLAFLGTLSALSNFHQKDTMAIKAGLLAEEGIEAVRYIAKLSWAKLSGVTPNTPRYLQSSITTWISTSVPEVIDGTYYRWFKTYVVYRNSVDDIVATGGTADPNTFLIESFVSWNWRGATSTVSYKTYVTKI